MLLEQPSLCPGSWAKDPGAKSDNVTHADGESTPNLQWFCFRGGELSRLSSRRLGSDLRSSLSILEQAPSYLDADVWWGCIPIKWFAQCPQDIICKEGVVWISQNLIKCLNQNVIIPFGNFVVYGSILLVRGFGQNVKYLSRPTEVALVVFGKTEDDFIT